MYNKEQHDFDYYLLGTVFNNMTGELYSGFYENGIIAATLNSGKKLVARGGTTPASVAKALAYGFYGIAFNSFIWDSEEPMQRFSEVVAEFRRQKIDLA